jgi:hypothetical protein
MPQRYCIEYDVEAANDLQKIYDYIQQDSPQNAGKMIERLIAAIEELDIFLIAIMFREALGLSAVKPVHAGLSVSYSL